MSGIIRDMRPRQGKSQDQGPDEDKDVDAQDWSYLGRVVRDRRADLGLTQAEVSNAGGPSPATLYLLESGRRDLYRPQILRRLERALGWRAGSVRRVLAGGQPVLDRGDEPSAPSREDRTSILTGQAWAAQFRQLPISRHDKLLILSRLLEETIAELSSMGTKDPSGPGQISLP
jgi:transcriptional regulator with XRE-family HTH domain